MSTHEHTPTLAEAMAKRQAADDQYLRARELVNSGRGKAAEHAVSAASDLEREADRLELLAWRATVPQLASVLDGRGYECPNGHEFPHAVEVKCEQCEASVACVPVAALIASHDD